MSTDTTNLDSVRDEQLESEKMVKQQEPIRSAVSLQTTAFSDILSEGRSWVTRQQALTTRRFCLALGASLSARADYLICAMSGPSRSDIAALNTEHYHGCRDEPAWEMLPLALAAMLAEVNLWCDSVVRIECTVSLSCSPHCISYAETLGLSSYCL